MRLRALIFDVDGTLAETEDLHRTAFNKAFAESGLGWHWNRTTYGQLLQVTGGKERIAAHAARSGLPPLPAETIARLHSRKTAIYGEEVARGALGARPGVDALIAKARARGLRLAVATTTSPENVDALSLCLFGRPGAAVFDVIAAGDEVAAKKPAPDVYLLALERLGVDASAALAFEDSRNGVLSARAAGLRVVVTPALYTESDDFTGATLVLPDLRGLPADLLEDTGRT